MKRAIFVVPLLGTLISIAVPLVRYAEKGRDEAVAIEVLREVREAQRAFRITWGAYALHPSTLLFACGAERSPLASSALQRLHDAGYAMTMRAAAGVAPLALEHCDKRSLGSDYYVAIMPLDTTVAAQQAFAARADGDIYLSYDGVAPYEPHMKEGLAIPLGQRATFRIP